MKRPIIHFNIDEQGEIQQIHGDLRLYEPLSPTPSSTPPSPLSLTCDALLLPDGNKPNEPFDQYKVLWTVTTAPFVNPEFTESCSEPNKIPTFIQLSSYFAPQTQIDLLIEPTTNTNNPQNVDIQIHVIFNDNPQSFDHVLLDLYDEPDLQQCLTTFIDQKEDRRYINDISKLVETVIELRRQFHRFKMKLTQSEVLD